MNGNSLTVAETNLVERKGIAMLIYLLTITIYRSYVYDTFSRVEFSNNINAQWCFLLTTKISIWKLKGRLLARAYVCIRVAFIQHKY